MKIKFYGANWCPDCRRSKQYLDEKGVEYEYINIEEVPGAAEEVEKINNGYQSRLVQHDFSKNINTIISS